MTKQEDKELELFKDWWNSSDEFLEDTPKKQLAEQAWFERAKLDKDKDETKDV